MKQLHHLSKVACAIGLVTLCGAAGEPPLRRAPSAEVKNLVEAEGIREVNSTPDEKSVVISFRARASMVPVVEIARERPISGAGGVLEFANRWTKANAKPIPNENEIVPTGYTVSIPELEGGTRYYYLITVGDGSSLRQLQGDFKTLVMTTNVTIVFTKVYVTNDSDPGGNGDLWFQFFANGGQASYGGPGNQLSWNDRDPPRSINEAIQLHDAPESLNIAVSGFDDDMTVWEPATGFDLADFSAPLNGPSETASYEANVAKQTFNLRDFAEGDTHFTLNSMSQAAGQGDLSFRVEGYFVIKREKSAP